MAPRGVDASNLHVLALLVPDTPERIRRELADYLDGEAGRAVLLVVCAQLLQSASRGDHLDLKPHPRALVDELVQLPASVSLQRVPARGPLRCTAPGPVSSCLPRADPVPDPRHHVQRPRGLAQRTRQLGHLPHQCLAPLAIKFVSEPSDFDLAVNPLVG